ncbi:MAG: tRNA pseudouridine(55) synthase TruB [Anaerolineae bacterium UTCFX2]|jgi:tRNA pseudouridine55 synthase|nr:tRNA pseudouridine(55) synthase TruB [Anaerolineales bacterium]OQY93504.1 MAG: tRNA pseudouridine(55) synthase TruB [Anaerolineae bacterium UTCFX2]
MFNNDPLQDPKNKREDRENIKNVVSGVLVVDKPIGLTSHDVVQIIRRGTGIRRAGHTGTLDPRASGVLVILIGPAVRLSEYVSASDKRYQATIRLGSSTDTYDAEGSITDSASIEDITEERFNEVLQQFVGEIEQIPPPYSAVKVQGRKAYDMARDGEEFELEPRMINVYSLEVLEWAPPEVVIDVYCSSGTYVRSLANDMGKALGTGAHLVGLRRTKSGRFTLRDAVPLRRLQEAFEAGDWYRQLIPAAEALTDWPMIELDADQVELIRHGHRIAAGPDQKGLARGVSQQGDLVALLEIDPETQEWQPRKVFFQS